MIWSGACCCIAAILPNSGGPGFPGLLSDPGFPLGFALIGVFPFPFPCVWEMVGKPKLVRVLISGEFAVVRVWIGVLMKGGVVFLVRILSVSELAVVVVNKLVVLGLVWLLVSGLDLSDSDLPD